MATPAVLTAVLLLASAMAVPAANPADQVQASCGTRAATLQFKGGERRNALGKCQPGAPVAAPERNPAPRQDKSLNCSSDARGRPLRGAERRSYIRSLTHGCQSAIA